MLELARAYVHKHKRYNVFREGSSPSNDLVASYAVQDMAAEGACTSMRAPVGRGGGGDGDYGQGSAEEEERTRSATVDNERFNGRGN